MGSVDASCLEDGLDEAAAAAEMGCESGMEDAVRVLLQSLGEDPERVAKAFREGTTGYKQKVNNIVHGAFFPEAGLQPGKVMPEELVD